jgi:hypothetical protein
MRALIYYAGKIISERQAKLKFGTRCERMPSLAKARLPQVARG